MQTPSPLFSPSSGSKTANFLTPSRVKHYSQHSTGDTTNFSNPRKICNIHSSIISKSPSPFDTYRNTNYFNLVHKNSTTRQESPLKILLKTGYDYQEEIKRLTRENKDLHSLVKYQREIIKEKEDHQPLLRENQQLRAMIEKLVTKNKQLQQQLIKSSEKRNDYQI